MASSSRPRPRPFTRKKNYLSACNGALSIRYSALPAHEDAPLTRNGAFLISVAALLFRNCALFSHDSALFAHDQGRNHHVRKVGMTYLFFFLGAEVAPPFVVFYVITEEQFLTSVP